MNDSKQQSGELSPRSQEEGTVNDNADNMDDVLNSEFSEDGDDEWAGTILHSQGSADFIDVADLGDLANEYEIKEHNGEFDPTEAMNEQEARERCWECPVCLSYLRILDTIDNCVNLGCNGRYLPATANIRYVSNYQNKDEPLDYGNEGLRDDSQLFPVPQPIPEASLPSNSNNNNNTNNNNNNNNHSVGGMLRSMLNFGRNRQQQQQQNASKQSKSMYRVWYCLQCDTINSMQWKQCANDRCNTLRQVFDSAGLEYKTEYVTFVPKTPNQLAIERLLSEQSSIQSYNNNNNNNNNIVNNNHGSFYRRNKRRGSRNEKYLLSSLGQLMVCQEYPAKKEKSWVQSNPRLIEAFGINYTNRYSCCPSRMFATDGASEEKSDNDGKMVYKLDENKLDFDDCKVNISFENERNMALNSINGWIATIFLNKLDNNKPYLYVFECVGSFEYKIVCEKDITDIFDETIKLARRYSQHPEIKIKSNDNKKPTIEDMIKMTRLRFIGNNIFIFCWCIKGMKLFQFKINSDEKKNKNIVLYNKFEDVYWTQAQVIDMDIMIGKDMDFIVILFGRWVGYYAFHSNNKKTPMKWFHAVAFVRKIQAKIVNSHSLLCINYDHTSDDNICSIKCDDLSLIENIESELAVRKAAIDEKDKYKFPMKNEDLNDKNENIIENRTDYSQINSSISSMKCDYNFLDERFERFSHRFYNFIQFGNDIISQHPTNPNYEYIRCSSDQTLITHSIYTVSKQFGTFYVNPTTNTILQYPLASQKLNTMAQTVLQLTNKQILHLCFDESYGISGRLLVFTIDNETKRFDLQYLTISSDLMVLNELSLSLPAYNEIYFKIYEFCYGTQFISKYFSNSMDEDNNQKDPPIVSVTAGVDTTEHGE